MLTQKLLVQKDAGLISLYRIFFGAVLLFYILFYRPLSILQSIYNPELFHFSFQIFDFMRLPDPTAVGLKVLFAMLAGSLICITIGFLFHASMVVFLSGFLYLFLLDKTFYNNHCYLFLLVGTILLFSRANARFSIDSLLKINKTPTSNSAVLWTLRILFCIVYFYAGVSKIQTDWLNGSVLKQILFHYPLSGNNVLNDCIFITISWLSMLTDLFLPFLLVNKRTRFAAFYLAIVFHLIVKAMLDIGVFPMFMLCSLILFFEPEEVSQWLKQFKIKTYPSETADSNLKMQKLQMTCLIFFLLVQTLIPLRHFVYPGEAAFNKQGDRFAWRMFSQISRGFARFYLWNEKGQKQPVSLVEDVLPLAYSRMTYNPDMIVQYAKYLRSKYIVLGKDISKITADVFVSVNGSNFSRLIDPEVDLLSVPLNPFKTNWILKNKQQEQTSIKGNNLAAFYTPAYQLAVIANGGILYENDPKVKQYENIINTIHLNTNLSDQRIADIILEAYDPLNESFSEYSVKLIKCVDNNLDAIHSCLPLK